MSSQGPAHVVMGIIDDAIAFAHERFRRVDGSGKIFSRVRYWWLQGAPGRELDKSGIEQLMADSTHGGLLDEDEVYARAGLLDWREHGHKSAAWRIAHGTHVMDLAAGCDPAEADDNRPIVCVQLPVRVTADTSGGSLFPYAFAAMTYIVRRARQITPAGTPVRVVINMSYGRVAGPHDGMSLLEDAIDRLVALCNAMRIELRVVLPAGNSYLARCHAAVSFPAVDAAASFDWRVLPDDRTPSFLEIWLPPGGNRRIELCVISPTGQKQTIAERPGAVVEWKGTRGVYGRVRCHVSILSGRKAFYVMLSPTSVLDPALAAAPPGRWRIELQNRKLGPTEIVHARVQRDDSLYGFPLRGRQSYLEHACYARSDHAGREIESDDPTCVIRRYGTLNAIATGKYPIVSGGYCGREERPARYSGAGPISRADPYRPDALAVSEDSRIHHGVLAAGSRSGSVVAMGGSSVAAPRVARLCADNFGGGADRGFVQRRAAGDELSFPAGSRPPQERGGAGRLKLDPLIPTRRYER